jgi:calnexin
MQSDITFDNIYIGHSIEDAAAFRSETYDVKRPIEDEEEAKNKPKPADPPKSPNDLSFKEDPVEYVKVKLDLFITIAKRDPIQAIKFMPEVAGAIGGAVALVIALIFAVVGSGSAAPSKETIKKSKDAAVDAKDKAAEAVASGVETAKAEVSKRTTRQSSSGQ